MATKHDEFKVHYFSFTDDEISDVVSALREYGNWKLADEIEGGIETGDIGKLALNIDSDISDFTLKVINDALNGIKDAGMEFEGQVNEAAKKKWGDGSIALAAFMRGLK